MQDAPFARGHGIESKWSMCFAHAFGGDVRRKAQLLDAHRAVAAGIETHAVKKLRVEANPSQCDIFQGLQQFGVVLKQEFLVDAAELHAHFRMLVSGRSSFRFLANFVRQIEARHRQQFIEASRERRGDFLAVEIPLADQWRCWGG